MWLSGTSREPFTHTAHVFHSVTMRTAVATALRFMGNLTPMGSNLVHRLKLLDLVEMECRDERGRIDVQKFHNVAASVIVGRLRQTISMTQKTSSLIYR